MPSTINADNGVSSGSAGLKSTADSSGVLSLQTNGTTAVTVDTSQNVGIGTSSPTQRFEVLQLDTTANRTSPINVAAITANSSASAGEPYNGFGPALVFRSRSYNGTIYNGPRVRMAINDNSVQTTQGASLAFDVTNTKGGSPVEAMLLDFNGNLGLGVTPSAWSGTKALQINGNAAISANGSAATQYVNNAYYNGSNWVYVGSYTATYYQQASGVHSWYTAPTGTAGNAISFTQAMTLDASGNLLVGTTSASAKITLKSASNAFSQGLGLVSSSSTNWWSLITDGSTNRLYFGYNGSSLSYIDQTTGMFIAVSDARVKKNIVDIGYGLDTVMQLRPVKYNMVNDNDTQKKRLGLIAQEVKGVIDEAVDNTVGIGGMLGLDKSVLVPVLIKAIQELKAEVDSLKSQLAAKG